MRHSALRHTVLISTAMLILAILVPGATLADEERRHEETVAFAGDAVRIETHNGSIQVRTWDRDEVEVVAKMKARGDDADKMLDDIRIEIEERGGKLEISADVPPSRGGGFFKSQTSASVSFEITVPRKAAIEADTHNGAIAVHDLGARAALSTHNGSVKAEGVEGALEVETQNGSIKALDVHGPIRAETTNGSVEAEIRAEVLSDDVEIETTNGSITLRLSSGVAATVDARTRNGGVKTDFPGARQDRRRKTLDLDLNGGGPRIELRSTNGGIRVEEI